MPFLRALCVVALMVTLPSSVCAGILNLRGGLGKVLLKDRETRESEHYAALLLTASYRSPRTEFELDLPLRWGSETGDFESDTWERKGDLLRPLKILRYVAADGRWSGGFEVLREWTPGQGYLVRGISGTGEIDYILPGLRFQWSDGSFFVDIGLDRFVDPSVLAGALTWRAADRFTVSVETAVDPDAPAAFAGSSSGGRPEADATERLYARAAGARFELVEGNVVALGLGGHAGAINGSSRGAGGEVFATFDFSRYYVNRLMVRAGSVKCIGGYVPAWFEAAYSLHRWGPDGQPFLEANPLDSAVTDRTMHSYGIEYDLGDFLSITGRLDHFTDDSLRRALVGASLREENGRGLELSVWSRTEDPDVRLFTEDAGLQSRVSALYNFLPHFLLNVSYEHSWAFREEEAGFKPLNSILVGVVYDISL